MIAGQEPGMAPPMDAGQELGAAPPMGASQELGMAPPMDAGRKPFAAGGLARFGVSGEQLLFWLLLALWVLNVADLLLTHYVLWLGFATEENGVMRYFLHEGTLTATVFKIGIVSVGALLLWRVRHRPAVLVAAALLVAVFAAVVAYQAAWALSL
jgi:Domain of unknown function (DUF5658)